MRTNSTVFLASLASRYVLAAPTVAFPINSQIPPVARIAQPFQYQFSSSTFAADPGRTLNYSIDGAPRWLSLQSNTRTLSGTPGSQDLGPFTFGLNAGDGGATAESQVTLLVVNTPAPSLSVNLTDVLAHSGPLSDLTSLNLHTGSNFRVAFPSKAFNGQENLTFVATSGDRTPLPSWITFNPEAITFTGTTPPPVPNPQTIPLRLIASSVPGFEDASFTFNLVVSDHTLAFSNIVSTVDVEPNKPIPSTSLLKQLLLDGSPIVSDEIASASATGAGWVSLDSQTLSISGDAPSNGSGSDVRIRVSDIYGNNANAYVRLVGASDTQSSTMLAPTAPTTAPFSTNGLPSQTSSGPSMSTSRSAAGASESANKEQGSHGWIAAAVVVPTFVAIMIVVFIWWCCRRRMRKKKIDTELGSGTEKQPRSDIEISGDGAIRPSEDSLGSHNQLVLENQRDSFGVNDAAYHRSQRYPTSSGRRSTILSPTRQRASRMSRFSMQGSSVSDSRRLTGLGHGRLRSFGSPSRVDVSLRVKARRRCTQCGSSDVETLGSSPPSTTIPRRSASEMLKPSIRMLPRDGSVTDTKDSQAVIQELLREVGEIDARTFQEKRTSYLKKSRSGRSDREERRTHDEHMYDLQKSYDRLKKELGSGSLRARPVSRPVYHSTSIRSHQAESLTMGLAPEPSSAADGVRYASMPASMQRPPASLKTKLSHATSLGRSSIGVPIASSQGSNEWTDTEDASSRSQRHQPNVGSRSIQDSQGEWEDEEEEVQEARPSRVSRVKRDSRGVPYVVGGGGKAELGSGIDDEEAQAGAEESHSGNAAFL